QAPQFEVKFHNNGENSAEGWLDYLILQARKPGAFSGQQLIFRDSRSVSKGRVSEFTIASTISDAVVWDVTDLYNPMEVQIARKSDSFSFASSTDSFKTFIVFRPQAAMPLQSKPRPVKNQDLHSSTTAEMVIITHPLFIRHAEMLADIHLAESGMTSLVVTPEQVYNEFSGGTADIAALRNFVRMKFTRQAGSSKPLKYLLLFGDGSYENRKQPPANPNFIPTYQSQNSNIVVSSFTSDDFFGLLEDGEGEADGTEDIGIGRLPVTDTLQAGTIISKIRKYMSPSGMGDWKNIICLTADDEDGNIHLSDAEGLSALLTDSVPEFGISKIYLDAFRQETSANGQSYPDVNKAINDRINAGCLIFNYIGHGNESGLAHERVIRTEDINSWKNGSRLPLFITATCEFSRFDDAEYNLVTQEFIPRTSAGESVLLSREGGAIALMSTTRVVYSAPNYTLNRNILDAAFDRDQEGKALRLGDIIRIAKNKSGNGSNKRNFSLLGDPALRLSYPWHGRVVTDSINNVHVSDGIDSLKALSLVTVSGHIEDLKGEIMNDFNGTIWPLVYDKDASVKTLANDGGQKVEFKLRNNILFSGKTLATNGRFSFTFLMPRDIDYSFGKGSVSYYAGDGTRDMNGNFSDIVVGGFSASVEADTTGPEIKLFMNDTLFRQGGITDENPRLLAILEDKGGINTTGAGIGHDISGYLDGDVSNSVVLNSYYENDLNSYSRGKVEYDITGLKPGQHTITLKAWDNFNNSSTGKLLFVVMAEDGFMLSDLINYPNPFTDETRISAGHNRPQEELEIYLAVYSYGGQKIAEIVTTADAGSYSIPPLIWDGTTASGSRAARGLYIYSLTVKTKSGEKATASGRLVIL
ncbi:MAG: type IX secretion system sortase PorU, partial [Bacteroidales bacterium]|nr:type IX secretion system sortase PorU [Bacteroidales bacterium]